MQRRLEQIDESITRYLSQLDSADRQGPTVPEAKITRLNEKIATLRDEIQRLNALNAQMIQTEGTSRSPLRIPMHARWPRAAGAAGSSVTIMQSAVDTKHHLIVSHEVTNVGTDRGQLSSMAEQARTAIGSETIEVVADRGYYAGEEILACEEAGITVYLPKPMTSGAKAKGRFGSRRSSFHDCALSRTPSMSPTSSFLPSGVAPMITIRHCAASSSRACTWMPSTQK
jgi:hypothetical protein